MEQNTKQRAFFAGFESFVGLLLGWFALSGGIGTFVLLRWIGVAQLVADAVAPLGVAGQAVLGTAATFLNFILLVFALETYRFWRAADEALEN